MSGIDYSALEFAQNPEARCPCVLLLDTSGSMEIDGRIHELNEGLAILAEELRGDTLASLRVEIAIVAFGGGVDIRQDFATVDRFAPPQLGAYGDTPLGSAITTGLNLIQERKRQYKANGVAYYRPWMFLITDGAPTDNWQPAAQRLRDETERKKVAFFAVGVQGADLNVLRQLSPRAPVMLRGLRFKEMFEWLSASLSSVSRSQPGEEVRLQPPTDWTQV